MYLHTQTSLPTYIVVRNGIYYFRKRVPTDLLSDYRSPEICFSLRTKHSNVALARARSFHSRLSDEFDVLRWKRSDNRFARYLRDTQLVSSTSNAPTLTEAGQLYSSMKGEQKGKAFHQSVARSVEYLTSVCGDKQVDALTRNDANNFRDYLLDKGLTVSSCRRVISVIRAMLNFVCRESELEEVTAFQAIHFRDEPTSTSKRLPIPVTAIRSIQTECIRLNDEPRWLIALISNAGLRLSEAVGLHVDDLVLDDEIPHVIVRPHSWRRLKTKASERKVPLVGQSLWGAKQAKVAASSGALFPKYCDLVNTKSNSASAALNKWLKPRVPDGCVVHSFRHSFKDILREVLCPVEVANSLGGWHRDGGVGEMYGEGYSLKVKAEWLIKAVENM